MTLLNKVIKTIQVGEPISVFEASAPFYKIKGQVSEEDLNYLETDCIESVACAFSDFSSKDLRIFILPLIRETAERYTECRTEEDAMNIEAINGIDAILIGKPANPDNHCIFRGFHRLSSEIQVWFPEISCAFWKAPFFLNEDEWYTEGYFQCTVQGFDISIGTWDVVNIIVSFTSQPVECLYRYKIARYLILVDYLLKKRKSWVEIGRVKRFFKDAFDYFSQDSRIARVLENVSYPLSKDEFFQICRGLGFSPEKQLIIEDSRNKGWNSGKDFPVIYFSPAVRLIFTSLAYSEDPKSAKWELFKAEKNKFFRSSLLYPFLEREIGNNKGKDVNVTRLKILIDRLRIVCCALRGHDDVWDGFYEASKELYLVKH